MPYRSGRRKSHCCPWTAAQLGQSEKVQEKKKDYSKKGGCYRYYDDDDDYVPFMCRINGCGCDNSESLHFKFLCHPEIRQRIVVEKKQYWMVEWEGTQHVIPDEDTFVCKSSQCTRTTCFCWNERDIHAMSPEKQRRIRSIMWDMDHERLSKQYLEAHEREWKRELMPYRDRAYRRHHRLHYLQQLEEQDRSGFTQESEAWDSLMAEFETEKVRIGHNAGLLPRMFNCCRI